MGGLAAPARFQCLGGGTQTGGQRPDHGVDAVEQFPVPPFGGLFPVEGAVADVGPHPVDEFTFVAVVEVSEPFAHVIEGTAPGVN